MHCSILLLDEDDTTIRHGAAPSLPAEYVKLLDGGVPIVVTSGRLKADAVAVVRKLDVSRILENTQSLDNLAKLVDLPVG